MLANLSRYFVLLFAVLAFSPLHAKADEPVKLAVEVDIRGGIVGFDAPAFATVRSIMASLVMDGTLEHWITTSRGLEGGGTYCMQFQPEFLKRKARVLAQFQNIQVDKVSTAYTVRELDQCAIPTLQTSSH